MKKNISVITGATGHVGYALVKELEKNNENFRILVRRDSKLFDGIDCERAMGDVTDYDSLVKAFQGAEVVYHLAGIIEINKGNEEMTWKVNVEGTKNVVRACKECGVKRLVYASSVDAYQPLPNNQLMSELPHFDPEVLDGTYAKTKAVSANYVFENNDDQLETIVVYPGACCGPYDFKKSSVGEMVRMFMGGKFPVSLAFGAYNFVDVRDVANGMYRAAKLGRPGEGYILTDEMVTIDQLLHILADICGTKCPSFKLPLGMAKAVAPLMEVYYDIMNATPLFTRYSIRKLTSNCNFSIEKAKNELGYKPMGARKSFADMVEWIAEYENAGAKNLKKSKAAE